MNEQDIILQAERLYRLTDCQFNRVPGHDGGRNIIYIVTTPAGEKMVLRISSLTDRAASEYLAETAFVHYLAQNGAPVADVLPSVNQKYVECVEQNGCTVFLSMFTHAKGMLLSDNGYRYRDGAPLEEYFFNTGKTLGAIHRLSKQYVSSHRRQDYADKYNRDYIDQLIPDTYAPLKEAIFQRFEHFSLLPVDPESYGLVHFDFSDGNYHIDMATGQITVFDFENCMYCWYMFDLANLWTHGEGWCRSIQSGDERMAYMKHYFDTILAGYRTETDVSEEMLTQLPLFIDMVLIENIVDEFECCAREGELPDDEDIEDAADCLIKGIPYAGLGMTITD